jgi:anti-sigma B factor antagonist
MPENPIGTVEALPELVVLHVQIDRLDDERLRRLQDELRAAADAHPGEPVALNLARVSFVPSLVLAGLIRAATEFRARGQRLVLCGLQPQVRDVFLVTRLDRLFELHENVEAARRALG